MDLRHLRYFFCLRSAQHRASDPQIAVAAPAISRSIGVFERDGRGMSNDADRCALAPQCISNP